MIRPLNELLARGANYHEYKSVSNKSSLQFRSRHVLRFRKKIDVQIWQHAFVVVPPIAVLCLLAKLKDACNLKRVPESIAVSCFQFYAEGPAKPFFFT